MPYYDRVERLVGISGQADRYPNMPDGIYAGPPHPWRCTEIDLARRLAPIGVPVLGERTAALSVAYDGRPKCHYCGACGHGCGVGARFSTLDGLLPKLRGRANFTLQTHAMAYEIPVDAEGRARGVAYVDARTRKTGEVRARAVVLAASTVESGRILLNSRSRLHPNGLANSSDLVGRHLMDTIKTGPVVGVVPHWRNRPRANEDGAGGTHVTIPRFNYNRKTDYHGGYFILLGSGFGRSASTSGITGFGDALKTATRDRYGATLSLRGYGECQSYRDNRFEIDPERKDAYGIPQVRFVCGHGDNERRMMADMYGWMETIMRTMDADVLPFSPRLEPLGDATHECGTARMGTDPKASVLNPWGQAHDVANLFVTDASGFVSMPGTHGITTLIMALALRASEYMVEELRTGRIA